MTDISMIAPVAQPALLNGLHLHTLAQTHLPQMMLLQSVVHEALPETHKTFILPKTDENFCSLLQHPNGSIGIFNPSDGLIAQAFLKIGHEADLAGLSDTPASRLLAKTCGRFGVPQGVVVHPAYRGQHLMRKMLHALEDHARIIELETLVTEVAMGNDRSCNGFMDDGYELAGNATDFDGTDLLFLRKTLRPTTAMPGYN